MRGENLTGYLDHNPNSYSSVQAWNPVFGINALAQVQFDPVGTNQWVNGAQTWIDLSSPDPDVIAAGAGEDTLAENVENLALIGTASINGTGNMSDNFITGNAAANVLAGGAGMGQIDLSAAYAAQLAPVLAASWH